MSANYKEYLAASILSEDRIVSYRTLSRALNVHANLAKQMLFDFYQKQNLGKPGSIHANFILSGTQKAASRQLTNGHSNDGAAPSGEAMRSSPPITSSAPPNEESEIRFISAVSLVREEDVERVRALYESISSIHVYSLEPHGLKDLQKLSDCNREISSQYAGEDPLVAWKAYGSIQNSNVKRRTARRPPPIDSRTSAKGESALASKPPSNANRQPHPQTSDRAPGQGSENKATRTSSSSTPKPTMISTSGKSRVQRESSNIFKSFANSKSKSKDAKVDIIENKKSVAQDESMKDTSEDEQEDDIAVLKSKGDDNKERQSKSEREEQLRKMMDAEDEEMKEEHPEVADEVMHDDSSALDAPKATLVKAKEPEKQNVVSTGGRRRGRRKVMKKKTVRDDEGYLVTRESPAWESFSESETEEVKVKKSASTAPAATGRKGGNGKPGQGNITSFFSKH